MKKIIYHLKTQQFFNIKNMLLFILTIFLCISLLGNCVLVYKYKNKGSGGVTVATVSQHYNNITTYKGKDDNFKEINILFIGNSITLHALCSYWWGEWGMAASSADKDYVHQAVAELSNDYTVNYSVVQFASWEMMGHDRAETLPMLDSFLKNVLDIIVIQLGENITSTDTIENDYVELINYINNSVPEADVFVIGSFFDNEVVDTAKSKAIQVNEAVYVDISTIKNERYQIKKGTVVQGNDGKEHIVDHEGVMLHPSDAGMKVIAGLLVESIRNYR